MMDHKSLETVIRYHDRTKHQHNRYAIGPGYLDWANQPNPFRRFEGTKLIPLPPILEDTSPLFIDIFEPKAVSSKLVSPESLSRFFELSLAISAWKQIQDSRWALRANPSSGNLHPTEGYLVVNNIAGIHSAPGVFHYAPKEHGLELRTDFSTEIWSMLTEGFPDGVFFVGLSSIHWRESWKYGERAFRYCQHDVGHALGALRISAASLGWQLVLLEGLSDSNIIELLGLSKKNGFDDVEEEHPDLVAAILPTRKSDEIPLVINPSALHKVANGTWNGKANSLSLKHVEWSIIDEVATASLKPESKGKTKLPKSASVDWGNLTTDFRRKGATARRIIRQRRSAVAFDGTTSISASEFYAILSLTQSRPTGKFPPWDTISWPASIHFVLFVHRVRDLPPGLYFFNRNPNDTKILRHNLSPNFKWEKPKSCPPEIDFRLLSEGNCQEFANQASCGQEIAGQGAFSLGMIARFRYHLQEKGAWFYRRLFWESGVVGQMLYLAAELVGVRGTGIGCYFDEPIHDILGLPDREFQSLYHFTIGGPVEDTRLTTLPAYKWEANLS